MCAGKLRALDGISMHEELKRRKTQLSGRLSWKLFRGIREQAFHYSEKVFNFSKFKHCLAGADTHIHVMAAGYCGDMLSQRCRDCTFYALSSCPICYQQIRKGARAPTVPLNLDDEQRLNSERPLKPVALKH